VTINVDLPPEIEQAYRAEAQARGLSFGEMLREVLMARYPKILFDQGLGLFGSPEDAALLDVTIAHEERRRSTKSPYILSAIQKIGLKFKIDNWRNP